MPRKKTSHLSSRKGRDAKGGVHKPSAQPSEPRKNSVPSRDEPTSSPPSKQQRLSSTGLLSDPDLQRCEEIEFHQPIIHLSQRAGPSSAADVPVQGHVPIAHYFRPPRSPRDSDSDSDDFQDRPSHRAMPDEVEQDDNLSVSSLFIRGSPRSTPTGERSPTGFAPEAVVPDEFFLAVPIPPPPPPLDEAAEQAAVREAVERLRARTRQLRTYLSATTRDADYFSLGRMTYLCRHCSAKYFLLERNTKGQYTGCCSWNKVVLPPLRPLPPALSDLFARSAQFKTNVLQYNHAFQFVSMEANLRDDIPRGGGPYVYSIQGKIYHHLSDVDLNGRMDTYSPVYYIDPQLAAQRRFGRNPERLDENVIRIVTDLLHEINPYAQAYRHLREVYEEQRLQAADAGEPIPEVVLELLATTRFREFDLPAVDEIAAVYRVNEALRPCPNLRVMVRDRPTGFQTVYAENPNNDPLTFPLLFPTGQNGWHIRLTSPGGHKITLCEYYAHRLAYRDNCRVLFHAGRLAQLFVVAAYVKIESNRVRYVETHQDDLLAEEYVGLADYLHRREQADDDDEVQRVGRMVVLPSTFVGSPRSQQQRFQDAMAVVCKLGNPSLFITVTCNPNWPEIKDNIPVGDLANNHPMLVSRVFQARLDCFLEEVKKDHVFGVPLAQLHVIEFQKRGLPHAHILTILREEDKPLDAFRIDQIISAEIPDPDREPELYELVRAHMIHGPCGGRNPGAPCTENGKCTKKFPKSPAAETTVSENGNVVYRRRATGRTVNVTRNGVRYEADNTLVVPYNPYSLLKYGCHINVEACASLRSVKYLYKYFFKSPDQAIVQLSRRDDGAVEYNEIKSFLNARYLAPPEAAWRINQFPMHVNSHVVVRLPVHLPHRQVVRFHEGREIEALERNRLTQLTAWFRLNLGSPGARVHLYPEIPYHYVWKNATRTWSPRAQGQHRIVTRIYAVSIRNQELYCLRLLLLHVRGATRYEDLRTVDGVLCDTFAEACRRRNLLADDVEWRRCLTEAAQRQMPSQIRQMFAYILLFCEVADPLALWVEFRETLMEDFVRRGVEEPEAEQRTLRAIQATCVVHGKRLVDYGLPNPLDADLFDQLVDVEQARQEAEALGERLNEEQRAVLEAVLRAVRDETEPDRLFYLNGPGGTGKTYLYNTLIATLQGESVYVLPVAWTGLAASLLRQGRTVHSRFKLPVPILDDSASSIRLGSDAAAEIVRAKLIVWDEISMATRLSFDLVEKALRFLCQNDLPFGGKAILLGGDFRQCLPVVRNGTRATIVEACVKWSRFWPLFRELRLRVNVRADVDQAQFSDWLLLLGNNALPRLRHGHRDVVEIPDGCVVADKAALISSCFPQLALGQVFNRAILTPLNAHCHEINHDIVQRLPGDAKVYLSADSLVREQNEDILAANYTPEFINTLTPSGMPQHRIVLKVGAIVMLIRNLNIRKHLCNGTRLLVRHLGNNFIDAERIDPGGNLTGDRVFIPRIDLQPTDSTLPFLFKRRQFPIIGAYAITINKAQGQTFDAVGIYLPNVVFAHGQLYVAFSRARRMDTVFVCIEDTPQQGHLRDEQSTHTANVVYPEVL